MQLRKRLFYVIVMLLILAGYVFFAAQEAQDREAARPEPAPIGVTFDPTESADTDQLRDGGFDFIAVQWRPEGRAKTFTTTQRVSTETGFKYAFFLNHQDATEDSYDVLYRFDRSRWQRYDGKPLVYVFGGRKLDRDPRFSIVHINDKGGDQYWVSNPPNIKYGHITLTPGHVSKNLSIDPQRTGAALDQQEPFAETNKDRVVLLLWHSWNRQTDNSAISGYPEAYDRVRSFNERWKRP